MGILFCSIELKKNKITIFTNFYWICIDGRYQNEIVNFIPIYTYSHLNNAKNALTNEDI